MIEEEMATEYASSLKVTDFVAKPKEIVAYFGYLAGLKAGRPQWHDLRKDPNDLPNLDKTDMSDYVITDRGVGYYNGRVKSWYIQNEYILSNDVIAWCEIPTFYKEIE